MTCATHAVPGEPGVSRHRNPPERIRGAERGGIPSSSVPLDRPPGAPVAIPIRGPDLREEESRCHSALAEDPRGDRRDRFRRRSVKTADFPDLGRLPPVSTLLGCSFVRLALPPAPDPSSLVSSPRDESRESETPGHTASGFPPGRCFARSSDAHRFLQYERRADTPRTPRLPLSGMPSGILVPAHLREDMREACGPAAPRDCSRLAIRTRRERERAARAMRDR
jgi:hypothetical protein